MLVVSQLSQEESSKPRPGKAKFGSCLSEGKLEFFNLFSSAEETYQEIEWFSASIKYLLISCSSTVIP